MEWLIYGIQAISRTYNRDSINPWCMYLCIWSHRATQLLSTSKQMTDQWPTGGNYYVSHSFVSCFPYPVGNTETCKIMFQNSWATTAIHIWIVVQLVMRDFKDPLLLDCCSTYLGLDVIMKSCFATVVRHFWICGESVSDTMLNNNLSWSGLGLIRIHKRREMVHLWVQRAFRTDTKQAFHYFSMAFTLKDVDRSEWGREEKEKGEEKTTQN